MDIVESNLWLFIKQNKCQPKASEIKCVSANILFIFYLRFQLFTFFFVVPAIIKLSSNDEEKGEWIINLLIIRCWVFITIMKWNFLLYFDAVRNKRNINFVWEFEFINPLFQAPVERANKFVVPCLWCIRIIEIIINECKQEREGRDGRFVLHQVWENFFFSYFYSNSFSLSSWTLVRQNILNSHISVFKWNLLTVS